MQRGIKESGVKRIRVHDLRRSHASMLIELGFSPLEIANRLGHEKVETTLNTYAHLYPNKQTSEAVQKEIVLKQENWSLHCRKVFKNMIGTCYYSCLQNSFEALMECSVRLLCIIIKRKQITIFI